MRHCEVSQTSAARWQERPIGRRFDAFARGERIVGQAWISPCAILNSCSSETLLSCFCQLTRRQRPYPPTRAAGENFHLGPVIDVVGEGRLCGSHGPHSPRTLAALGPHCSGFNLLSTYGIQPRQRHTHGNRYSLRSLSPAAGISLTERNQMEPPGLLATGLAVPRQNSCGARPAA
jgi:hypothetical protein